MSWRDRPGAPAPGMLLCRLDELDDPGSRGFGFGGGNARFEMFVVRAGGRLRGYVNECPHARSPLDWRPDVFLDLGRRFILCSNHGAHFRIDDGYCVRGPCPGRSLEPVPLALSGDEIHIADCD